MFRGLAFAAAVAAWALACAQAGVAAGRPVEVVAELELPSLSRSVQSSRVLRPSVKRARLSLTARMSAAYLQALSAEQAAVAHRIHAAVPDARVRWRYRIVLNGLAVVLPERDVQRLTKVPGVARVTRGIAYPRAETEAVLAIKAPILWGSDFSTAGGGVKIGIVDDGVDQTHPYFDPGGYQAPAGFPRGQRALTTPKVIVARAFPPPTSKWKYAGRAFDPVISFHGTHVAGIAAGNWGTRASGGVSLSGVAPRAYIGNYKVLTTPTPGGIGPNGNSPEIVAGIEAAVADGMDVVNLSLGEPEIEPRRDIVARAIDAAADVGVVPAVAAGNAYDDLGRGSVLSPGSASKAITAGAIDFRDGRAFVASFSSSGPSPMSLLLKPDVAAPGQNVLSSAPDRRFSVFSGTSMAAPHVAGGAALLLQRHPTWTVEQIKSALVTTGVVVKAGSVATDASVLRVGGGLIDLTRADDPAVFFSPTSVSFGLVRPGRTVTRALALTDAGGGAGAWAASVELQTRAIGVTVEVPGPVSVPGSLALTARPSGGAPDQDVTGYVILTRERTRLRVPFWFRVARARLARARAFSLGSPGAHGGNTAGRPALVDTYRYPENPAPVGVSRLLKGPEQVFRFRLRRPVANLGVAVVSRAPGVTVEPRVVAARNENRLMGEVGLPINVNPYLGRLSLPEPVAGAVLPLPGVYDIVFDSRTRAGAGRFAFRFWLNDTIPPRLRLVRRVVPAVGLLAVAATDRGAGVDPRSVIARIDGRPAAAAYDRRSERVRVLVSGLARGRHRLSLQVSDYQETKNMESVARVLPNTKILRTWFDVR
ncbi:MAG: S8 family serine peptidase [Gaiellaceae bacterium]